VALTQQTICEVRAKESGSAGDQYVHSKSLSSRASGKTTL
jgi:hypothetical protein